MERTLNYQSYPILDCICLYNQVFRRSDHELDVPVDPHWSWNCLIRPVAWPYFLSYIRATIGSSCLGVFAVGLSYRKALHGDHIYRSSTDWFHLSTHLWRLLVFRDMLRTSSCCFFQAGLTKFKKEFRNFLWIKWKAPTLIIPLLSPPTRIASTLCCNDYWIKLLFKLNSFDCRLFFLTIEWATATKTSNLITLLILSSSIRRCLAIEWRLLYVLTYFCPTIFIVRIILLIIRFWHFYVSVRASW